MSQTFDLQFRIRALIEGLRNVQSLQGQIEALVRELQRFQRQSGQAGGGLNRLGQETQTANRHMAAFKATIASLGLGVIVEHLHQLTEEYTMLMARLRLATREQGNFNEAQEALFRIAQDTTSPLEATITLYSRIARNAKVLKISQNDLLTVTKAVEQSLQISGTMAGEDAGGLLQLSQALASGVLQGDEFRSVIENMPRLAQAIADGLKTDVAGLRQLSKEGKLTAQEVIRALLSQAKVLEDEYQFVPLTIEAALTQARNAWQRYIGEANEAAGATRAIAQGISSLAMNFEQVAEAVLKVGAVFVAVITGKMVSSLQQWGAATLANIQAQLAQQAATVANLEAQARSTAATAAHTEMLLADARAAVAAAAGVARLAAAENILVPAQQRAAAAAAAHAAAERELALATAAAGRTSLVTRGLLGLLGGPIGAITTMLALGTLAWFTWGNQAEAAGKKAEGVLARANQALESLRNQQTTAASGGNPLAVSLRELSKLYADQTLKVQALEKESLGFSLWPAGVIKRLSAARKEAAETLAKLQEVGAAYAEFEKNRPPSPPEAEPLIALPALDLTQAKLAQHTALLKDSLARELLALEYSHEQGLMSLEDYYQRRADLQTRALDAEITLTKGKLLEARKTEAQVRQVIAKDTEGKEQEQNQGNLQKTKEAQMQIETQLLLLERQRADIATNRAREQTGAEKTLNEQLDKAKIRLLEAQGQTAEAAQAQIEAEYKTLIAALKAEGDQEGLAIIEKLIDVEAAKAQLSDLEKAFQRALDNMSLQEQRIQADRDAGLISEIQARKQIIDLHQNTKSELDQLIPKMRELAKPLGKEAQLQVEKFAEQVHELGIITNQTTARIRASAQDSLVGLFDNLTDGIGKASDAIEDFAKDFLSAVRRIIIDSAVQQLFDLLPNGNSGKGGNVSGIMGLLTSFFHSGGIVGSTAPQRSVSPAAFLAAPRYHSGGLAGLKADEVPAILQRGEEVLTRDDPRHRFNQGSETRNVVLQVSPSVMGMTLQEWFEGYLASELAQR
jgi:tape measure domain-containing protein